MKRIILASASPRRKEILAKAGLIFEVIPSRYEEDMSLDKEPKDLVMHLALEKAREVAARNPGALVIGADTFIFLGNQVIGKPKDKEDLASMIKLLSGRTHSVFTGVSVVDGGKEKVDFQEAKITFRELSNEEIVGYSENYEEWHDKAGGYAIQGVGASFIDKIDGDYLGIVGLPLTLLTKMLTDIEGCC